MSVGLKRSMGDAVVIVDDDVAIIKLSSDDHLRERALLVGDFADQVVRVYDPDAIRAFLAWKDDDKVDTIVNLAMDLSSIEMDRVIDFIEHVRLQRERSRPRAGH